MQFSPSYHNYAQYTSEFSRVPTFILQSRFDTTCVGTIGCLDGSQVTDVNIFGDQVQQLVETQHWGTQNTLTEHRGGLLDRLVVIKVLRVVEGVVLLVVL